MAVSVVMPALEMAQETGKLVSWKKKEGEQVKKGEMLLEVETGQVWIGGRNVTWEEPKDRGIAMVFQSYALYPRMNVRGNLSFGLKMAKTP